MTDGPIHWTVVWRKANYRTHHETFHNKEDADACVIRNRDAVLHYHECKRLDILDILSKHEAKHGHARTQLASEGTKG